MKTRTLSTTRVVFLCLIVAALHLQACGGGSVVVSAGKPGNPETGEPGETNIGSPLPSAIRIPPVPSLEGSAYVITTSFPLDIFRYDLEGEAPYPFVPYVLAGKIQGIPDELLILDEDNAFFTTSGGIADAGEGIHLFDPNPPVPEAFSLTESVSVSPVTLDPPLPDSEGDPVSRLQPRYTSGVAESNGKLYVCTSNFTATGGSPVCPPGTVFIYDWNPGSAPPTITASDPSFLVTTGFNPTEVTALGERFVLVTNTGVVAIRNARAVPLTDGSVDVIDTELDCIVASYPLGLGAPSYKPIAIAPDGSRALLGSVAYNSVYELDLTVLDDLPESCPDSVPLLEEAVLAGVGGPDRCGPRPGDGQRLHRSGGAQLERDAGLRDRVQLRDRVDSRRGDEGRRGQPEVRGEGPRPHPTSGSARPYPGRSGARAAGRAAGKTRDRLHGPGPLRPDRDAHRKDALPPDLLTRACYAPDCIEFGGCPRLPRALRNCLTGGPSLGRLG